jgi:putative Ca2+/H+ antiporter (TMEM165/GDT1 family)
MNWSAFLTALGLVFVAELGDKTQLAVVTQVCTHRRPWAVFGGASLALTLVTAVGAAGGEALGRLVPQDVLQAVAAGAFVVMGLLVARQASKAERNALWVSVCEAPRDEAPGCGNSWWSWHAFGSTLGLLFVAELGDKTQLAVLSLAGQYRSAWSVFLGGSLALTGVTALGVLGGEALCRLIPERTILWVSAAAFVVIGALMAFGAL